MADSLRVAAAQVAERRRAHRAGRADFRLTAARRARDGGFCRDDLSDGTGDIHRAHHRIVVQSLTGLIGQQHRGQNAAASRRRRGDDALHTGVAFAHFERLCNDLPDVIPADRLAALHIGAHFRAVAADHAAGGAQSRIISGPGAPDGSIERAHFFKGRFFRHAAIHAVAVNDDVAEILIFARLHQRAKRFNGHIVPPVMLPARHR